ncbi:MAG: TonB-dependent receptor [Bacteroidales bacterium]|nr:TonB-dependent receptor [Bacteroidales bacterium]MCF8389269.1 TonB-dependent receptor [Bacteroidales bacterium]
MNYKRLIILFLVFAVPGLTYAQTDSLQSLIGIETLGATDLNFEPDSSLKKMVSTGRISKNSDELPFSIYVISHDEILKNQYNTLTDVLNSLPGIQTSQPGSGELGESFQIWGLTGNLYTKILINGIPVKPSVVSGMPIGSQLPIRQAEKIEVIYGNASAIYGADAVSGVINIITKEADKGTFVRGDIGLGEGGYDNINFFIGGKGGKNNNILQYSFYGSKSELTNLNVQYEDEDVYNPLNYYQARGEKFTIGGAEYDPLVVTEDLLVIKGIDPDDFIRENYGENYEGDFKRPEMQDLGTSSHMMGMLFNFRGVSLSYDNMYRRTHSSLGLSPAFYKYNNPQNYWGDRIEKTSLSYKKEFLRFSSNSLFSYLVYKMDNNSSQGLTFIPEMEDVYRYSASNDMMFEQSFSGSLLPDLELVAGFSYNQSGNLPVTNFLSAPFNKSSYSGFSEKVSGIAQGYDEFGINPIVYSNSSGFLQSYYTYKRYRVLTSLRYDMNTLYGNNFSPHIAILHKTNARTSWRISTGTSYKAPPASIAYQSLAYKTGPDAVNYMVVPNPNLRPENFNTLELGLNTTILKRVTLYQTLFLYQIRDHIISETKSINEFALENAINDSVRTWVNNTKAISNMFGSQTTFRIDNLVKSINMDVELSLIFQERQDRMPNVREIVAEYFNLTPRHMGKLKISMEPAENLYIYIESHWMSKWLRVLIPFEGLYDELFNETDGYYAMNFMASYNLSQNLNIFLKANNLFDEKYGSLNATFIDENLVYNPQSRRNISFGLSYRLN